MRMRSIGESCTACASAPASSSGPALRSGLLGGNTRQPGNSATLGSMGLSLVAAEKAVMASGQCLSASCATPKLYCASKHRRALTGQGIEHLDRRRMLSALDEHTTELGAGLGRLGLAGLGIAADALAKVHLGFPGGPSSGSSCRACSTGPARGESLHGFSEGLIASGILPIAMRLLPSSNNAKMTFEPGTRSRVALAVIFLAAAAGVYFFGPGLAAPAAGLAAGGACASTTAGAA